MVVSDGVQFTSPSAASIHFLGAPVITQQPLNMSLGRAVTLTSALLNVTVTDGSTPSQILLSMSDLQHARINNLTNGSFTNFTLAHLQTNPIQLTQDGSATTPSYTLTVRGGISGYLVNPVIATSHSRIKSALTPRNWTTIT